MSRLLVLCALGAGAIAGAVLPSGFGLKHATAIQIPSVTLLYPS
jgi:hypothetical protein